MVRVYMIALVIYFLSVFHAYVSVNKCLYKGIFIDLTTFEKYKRLRFYSCNSFKVIMQLYYDIHIHSQH